MVGKYTVKYAAPPQRGRQHNSLCVISFFFSLQHQRIFCALNADGQGRCAQKLSVLINGYAGRSTVDQNGLVLSDKQCAAGG